MELCISDVKVLALGAIEAFHELQHNLTNGTIMLLELIPDLKDAMANCTDMTADVQALEKWLSIFADPATAKADLRAGITRHMFALTRDLAKARKYWK